MKWVWPRLALLQGGGVGGANCEGSASLPRMHLLLKQLEFSKRITGGGVVVFNVQLF